MGGPPTSMNGSQPPMMGGPPTSMNGPQPPMMGGPPTSMSGPQPPMMGGPPTSMNGPQMGGGYQGQPMAGYPSGPMGANQRKSLDPDSMPNPIQVMQDDQKNF